MPPTEASGYAAPREWVMCDAAPANVAGSSFLKQATFIQALGGFPPFEVLGVAVICKVVPSTPQGQFSGPWRSSWTLQYANVVDQFPFNVPGANNPILGSGMLHLADALGGDGATFIEEGQVAIDARPIPVARPDFGLALQWRISTEFNGLSAALRIRTLGGK